MLAPRPNTYLPAVAATLASAAATFALRPWFAALALVWALFVLTGSFAAFNSPALAKLSWGVALGMTCGMVAIFHFGL